MTAAKLSPRVSCDHRALDRSSATQSLRARALASGFYSRMLSEDFVNQQYAHELRVKYEGDDNKGNVALGQLLGEFGQGRRDSVTQQFLHLVSVVASDHLNYGESVFELFGEGDSDDLHPRLGILPGWSLKRRMRQVYQVSPADEVVWSKIPAAVLVNIALPRRLGKKLQESRRRLLVLDSHRAGSHDMVMDRRFIGYDFSSHQKRLDEMAAHATKAIGWDGRKSFMGRATNSYRTYRELRFLRVWLMVVSATEGTLNRILGSLADDDSSSPCFRVSGIPTIDRVDRALKAVYEGGESLDEIFYEVLHPRYSRNRGA